MLDLKYYIINKPYGTLSQFSEEGGHPTLASLYQFEKDVYPVGRLDRDSEGLLILTNDKTLNQKLLNPKAKKTKTYLVQVDNDITLEALNQLVIGVEIRIKKNFFLVKATRASKVSEPEWLKERVPPVRYRASIPTSWVEIVINEGKNRQVRRMLAKVGFPVLRLIREEISGLHILDLGQKVVKQVDGKWLMKKLGL